MILLDGKEIDEGATLVGDELICYNRNNNCGRKYRVTKRTILFDGPVEEGIRFLLGERDGEYMSVVFENNRLIVTSLYLIAVEYVSWNKETPRRYRD